MGRRREREWKIELDGEAIENALEKGAKELEQSLKNFKGVKLSVSSKDDDDDDEKKRPLSRRERKHLLREKDEIEQSIAVPPETNDEHGKRLATAIFTPTGFWTLGGMCIPAFINLLQGDAAVGIAFLAAGGCFYLASAANEFRNLGEKRERQLRKQILAGELTGYVPTTASSATANSTATASASPKQASASDSPRAQMEALIARIKTRLDPDQPAVSISELARYSEIASHYETKASEIREYLNEVGGVAPAQTDLARLRVQLEQYPPDDPRIDSTTKLISIKEQTVRNLQSLERYLATVEGKFHEQIAHLESLDSALMRHKLGTFARQTHAEETLSTREVSSLAQGLTETADALEHDLQRINLELA